MEAASATAVHVLVAYPLPEWIRARLEGISPRLNLRYLDRLDLGLLDEAVRHDPDLEVIVGARMPSDLAAHPRLRWLQLVSAGIDHIVGRNAWPDGLMLTNARGIYAVPIAQYVIGAMLHVSEVDA